MVEYAVMKKIGDNAPEVYADGYFDKDKAWNALSNAEDDTYNVLRDGINVKNAAEAARAIKEFEEVTQTRFYIAHREVSAWEED